MRARVLALLLAFVALSSGAQVTTPDCSGGVHVFMSEWNAGYRSDLATYCSDLVGPSYGGAVAALGSGCMVNAAADPDNGRPDAVTLYVPVFDVCAGGYSGSGGGAVSLTFPDIFNIDPDGGARIALAILLVWCAGFIGRVPIRVIRDTDSPVPEEKES